MDVITLAVQSALSGFDEVVLAADVTVVDVATAFNVFTSGIVALLLVVKDLPVKPFSRIATTSPPSLRQTTQPKREQTSSAILGQVEGEEEEEK